MRCRNRQKMSTEPELMSIPMRVTVYMFFEMLGETIVHEWLPAAAVLIITLVIAWLVPNAISTVITRLGIRPHYVKLISTLIHFGLIVFSLYCTLHVLGFNLLEVLLTFGISSLGFSIALSPILSDYFAGIQIELYDIVEPRSVIQIGGIQGLVIETGRVNVVLYNAESDRFYVVPNRTVISTEITYLPRAEAEKVAGKQFFQSVLHKRNDMLYNQDGMFDPTQLMGNGDPYADSDVKNV